VVKRFFLIVVIYTLLGVQVRCLLWTCFGNVLDLLCSCVGLALDF
jgi:hypothetical protein